MDYLFGILFFSRLHGSYEALKYGSMLDGLADLTGGITECVQVKPDITACTRLLHKILKLTSIITCIVQPPSCQIRSHHEKLSNGIQLATNYGLHSIERVSNVQN